MHERLLILRWMVFYLLFCLMLWPVFTSNGVVLSFVFSINAFAAKKEKKKVVEHTLGWLH